MKTNENNLLIMSLKLLLRNVLKPTLTWHLITPLWKYVYDFGYFQQKKR